MRFVLLLILSSSALAGPAFTSGNYQHNWFAESNSFVFVFPVVPTTNLAGSIDIGTDVTYNGLSFAAPSSTASGTVDGFDFSVTYDSINISAPNFTTPVISSTQTTVTSAGMPSTSFVVPDITGSFSITGPLGTVESGAFSFDTIIQDLRFVETIDVVRDGGGNITDYDWNGGVNLTVLHLTLSQRAVFDGVIDGQDFLLRYDGGNLQLSSGQPPPAIPEPSAALMLMGLCSIVGARRYAQARIFPLFPDWRRIARSTQT